jgi:hypothetical protein
MELHMLQITHDQANAETGDDCLLLTVGMQIWGTVG